MNSDNEKHYFIQVPAAFQMLHDAVERTMKHAIEEEEKIAMSSVTNFDEVTIITFS